jgi:tripartite-type tricarboxylate transporter receptor subunit TctC
LEDGMKRVCELVAILLMATAQAPALAQPPSFPGHRPITLVLPSAAGGAMDLVARDLAEALHKALGGAALVVDNVAGAAGAIGANKVARAKPDGYTLLLQHIGMATMPYLVRNLPFQVDADFEYLGLINEVPMVLMGRPDLPASNYRQLVHWLHHNPRSASLAHAGTGSASHLCALLLQDSLRVDVSMVAYKGTSQAMTDLLGGKVDLLCDQTTHTSTQIAAHKVQAYAVTTARRLSPPALRDLPTLQESGLADFELTIWHGLYAPKGTPPAVLARLNSALRAALQDPDFVRKQARWGAVVITDARTEPVGHKQFVLGEMARWGPLLRAAGVSAE